MICYECGTKAQRREIRNAKKEMREPQITDRCGSWEKGQCGTCRKRKIYVTPISDFIRVSVWLSTTYGSGGGPPRAKSLQPNNLGLHFLNKKTHAFQRELMGLARFMPCRSTGSTTQKICTNKPPRPARRWPRSAIRHRPRWTPPALAGRPRKLPLIQFYPS